MCRTRRAGARGPGTRLEIPSAAGSAGEHPQAGRWDTTARGRGTGGQGSPKGGCGRGPDADIRAGVSRSQLWIPAGAGGARRARCTGIPGARCTPCNEFERSMLSSVVSSTRLLRSVALLATPSSIHTAGLSHAESCYSTCGVSRTGCGFCGACDEANGRRRAVTEQSEPDRVGGGAATVGADAPPSANGSIWLSRDGGGRVSRAA